MWVYGGGHNHLVKYLINQGAIINSRDYTGTTPLMVAAFKGKERVVQTLLDAGANINAQSTHGFTALMYAVLYDHPRVVRLLLERKARLNFTNNLGRRAANLSRNNNMTRLLAERKARVNSAGGTIAKYHRASTIRRKAASIAAMRRQFPNNVVRRITSTRQ